MPELPEVETVVRGLAPALAGARIERVEVLRADLIGKGDSAGFVQGLVGRRVEDVSRRAKNVVVRTDDPVLVVNLGMTGRLLLSANGETPSHLGVRFGLDRGRELLYRDVRRFGVLSLLSPREWRLREQRMGLEPLSQEFTPRRLHQLTRGSRVALKQWLMDQRKLAGVGNIYASEALHRAGIHPGRRAGSLSRPRAGRLQRAILAVLEEAVERRGTTLRDYRDASGEPGQFRDRLRVYGREGEPCGECGRAIRRIVQQNRSTFYCPGCQR
ncbi:MAG: bifunctional DNA-formamidopyrimidine glycosylase/DNA-(apurinic or apyrimidinic site) lyase [Longimicrobiaceae bacterium]